MYEAIPHELKSDKCWVNVWKTSKKPMQTAGTMFASSTDPDTWGTYEQAAENVESGIYDGIGYVFHDNQIVGIDIDAGHDEDGFLSALAVDIISRCKSYTERSRSGRGFHIFLQGDLPFNGKNNKHGTEIYKSGRYFIMTGAKMFFDEIIENQEAIDYILTAYFQDDQTDDADSQKIYCPVFPKPQNGEIYLQPQYPAIQQGGRHLCMVSLAGQLHKQGYTKSAMYREMLYANQAACKPPLQRDEIESIVCSVIKYRR